MRIVAPRSRSASPAWLRRPARSSAWVESLPPQHPDPTPTLGASPSLHVHPVSLGWSAPSLHVTLSTGSPCPVSPNHGRSRQPITTTPHTPRGAPTREIDITLPYVCKFFDPPASPKRLRCGKTMPSRLKTGSRRGLRCRNRSKKSKSPHAQQKILTSWGFSTGK